MLNDSRIPNKTARFASKPKAIEWIGHFTFGNYEMRRHKHIDRDMTEKLTRVSYDKKLELLQACIDVAKLIRKNSKLQTAQAKAKGDEAADPELI